MKRKTGKEVDPSSLVIDAIEKEVLPRLQDGGETYLVVAQKELQILALPSLPGVPREETTGLMPRISKPERLRDKWHKDGLTGFAYVISGEADLLLGHRVVACHAGNFAFFLPHTWRNRGFASHWERPGTAQTDCDLLWIFLKEKEVSCHMCWSRGEEHLGSRHLFIPDDRLLTLVELLQDGNFQDEALQAAGQLLWCIYDRVRRKLREGNFLLDRVAAQEIPDTGESAESIGQRAQNYVDANLMQRMTLESVARAVLTSRARLAHEFKSHTGETFGAYLLRCRIKRAQFLLTTTSMSIRGVAWRVGFTDPDYFSTTFRRIIGITPTEFRKKRR